MPYTIPARPNHSHRKEWIVAIVIVALPVLLMAGCAVQQAQQTAADNQLTQDDGAGACEQLVTDFQAPGKVKFVDQNVVGLTGMTVTGHIVTTRNGRTVRSSFKCDSIGRTNDSGDPVMHLDKILDE